MDLDVPDSEWLPLRLRVLRTSILPKQLGLAVLDAYAETQFGRDVASPGSETPRIRLKEMPVSKLHATVFWDKARCEWAVVDMGSKHGTFVQPARLLDAEPLIIGSTTFLCHIHDDRTPCAECTFSDQGIIPLFAVPKVGDRAAEKRPSVPPTQEARDAKKALTSLRRTLLARLDPLPTQPSASYVDRSARRRAMHPSSQFDSPGVQGSRSSSPGPRELPRTPSSTVIGIPPLPENNVGRRLLMKQGWQPGTSLGSGVDESGGSGLVDPIEVHAALHRAGIGMPQSYQERRERRWESVQSTTESN